MSARRTERLVNLVICLLATRRFLTVEQIHAAVPGYDQAGGVADEAFRRMFERDKEELRELGIPLQTGSHSGWDDEVGYRIASRDYALPEITLEPDEAAALGLAARLWQSAGLARAATSALVKLRAAGVEVEQPVDLEPRVAVTEPAFEPCLTAVRAGRVIAFNYRTGHSAETARRVLEPWGVVSWRGRWYVVGHDRNRDATRAFRLSRIQGDVQAVGRPGAVQPPAHVDLVAAVAARASSGGNRTARLWVRPGAAVELRRRGQVIAGPEPAGLDEADPLGLDVADPLGWDLLELAYSSAEQLADEVAGFGADVVVVDPPEAQAAVIRRLSALVGP